MKKKFYTCMVSAVVAGSILFSPISSYAADPTAPVEIEGPSQEETTTVEEISSQDTTETITETPTEAAVTETPASMAEISSDPNLKTGTLQIMYGYMFSDGSYDPWISVPGAAIGKNTIVTDDVFDVVRNDSPIYQKIMAERKDGYATLGVDITNVEVVKAGCTIMIYDGSSYLKHGNLQVRETNNGTNYSVITTEETLNNYGKFSATGVELGKTVYAAGFSTSMMDTSHYTTDADILEQQVTISGLGDDGIINFTIDSPETFCSLVNENGEVLAIITDITNGSGRAVQAVDIESYLDEIQVNYIVGNEQSSILTTNLKNAIKDAEKLSKEDYTKESYEYLLQAVNKGKSILESESVVQADVDSAANDIINAMNKLEEQKHSISAITIVIIAIICIVFIGGIVFIALFLIKPSKGKTIVKNQKKKPEKKAASKEDPKTTYTNTANDHISFNSISESPSSNEDIEIGRGRYNVDYEAGTSVLTADMLGNGHETPKVFLIRERTKERIVVEDNDGPFTIGKSQKASYQILNNEAISRIHCRISWLNGELFIFDNDSTNHTFVQGNQIPVNIPYPIHNGEKIVMANETFTVEIRQ